MAIRDRRVRQAWCCSGPSGSPRRSGGSAAKPMPAIRSSSRLAVAKVPCTGLPSASQPPVERGKNSYQELNSAWGRSTHTLCDVPLVIRSRSGSIIRICATSGDSAGPTRSSSGRPVSRSAAAAALSGTRSACWPGRRAARSSSRAPVIKSFSSSASVWPAAIFASMACRQLSQGSAQPSTRKTHQPTRSGTTVATNRSVPGGPGCIRTCLTTEVPGPRQTTVAPTASCPSRQTAARTGSCSPTTALLGYLPHETVGVTSSIAIRPLTAGAPSLGPGV